MHFTSFIYSITGYHQPAQVNPSPLNPGLQEQVNDPLVLVQDAAVLHGLLVVHSLISRRWMMNALRVIRSGIVDLQYFIGQKFVRHNCRNFGSVSKILSDEKFCRMKFCPIRYYWSKFTCLIFQPFVFSEQMVYTIKNIFVGFVFFHSFIRWGSKHTQTR